MCCDEFGLPVEKLFLFFRNGQRIPKDSLNFLNSNKKQTNKQISSAWSVSLFKTPSPRASSEVSSVFHVFQGPNGLFSNAPSSPSKEFRASSAHYCPLMSLCCPFGSSPVWSTHTSPHQEHTAKTPDVHLLLPPSLTHSHSPSAPHPLPAFKGTVHQSHALAVKEMEWNPSDSKVCNCQFCNILLSFLRRCVLVKTSCQLKFALVLDLRQRIRMKERNYYWLLGLIIYTKFPVRLNIFRL